MKIEKIADVFFSPFCKDKSNILILYIIFTFILINFEDKLISLFDKYIIGFISIETTSFTYFIFIIIFLFFALTDVKKLIKFKFKISFNRFLFYTFLDFIYIYFRTKNYYSNKYIYLPENHLFSYLDLLCFLLIGSQLTTIISHFLTNKSKIKKTTNEKTTDLKLGFISDEPAYKLEDDILDYAVDAKNLAKILEEIPVNSPCSIGIISNWGKGKSTYLNFVENSINKDKFIIVKFNPRHSKCANNIQEDFFNLLYSKLKKYNSGFSSLFKDYMKAIGIINKNNFFSIVLNIYKIWNKDNEKSRLSKAIYNLPKRVIVFIEDFDRLLSDEIIEIFKLIDGNASINNIIFITAYDKVHINKIIGDSLKNEAVYFSDKFFTWEVQIPFRPYIKTYNYFEEKILGYMHFKKEELDIYKSKLNTHYKIIETYLPTLRDVKRFINMFARQYQSVEGEVELNDYLLVSLIKYRYPNEHQCLFQKKYIHTNILSGSTKYYHLNEDGVANLESIEILKVLFDKTRNSSYRGINNVNAFDIYFQNTIYGSLTIKQMSSLMELDEKEAILKLNEWERGNQLNDVFDFLESKNIKGFKDKEEFGRYLLILFYLSLSQYHTMVYISIIRLIYESNSNEICEAYNFSNIEEYKNLIIKNLKRNSDRFPYQVIKKIIINILNNEFTETIIFNHDDVLLISNYYLDEMINNSNNDFNNMHMELLYCCISNIDQQSHHVILDGEACNKVKDLIINNPIYYINNFVRLGMISSDPNFNSVACEPFWGQIFGNAECFEELINSSHVEKIKNINLVRNFWELYRNNDYNPIEFQNEGKVQEKIDNELNEEIDRLNDLKKIKQKFDTIKSDTETEDTTKVNLCNDLITKINNIKLYIKMTVRLRKDIEEYRRSIENKLQRKKIDAIFTKTYKA